MRDDEGDIVMKRGSMHTLEGHEYLPYFVVQRGDKDTKRFEVYDAASGARMLTDALTKQEAIDSTVFLLIDEDKRQAWILKRETVREIEQEQIDEYNNDHDVETEGFESFSREDIAGVSGTAKFSVYDDIRTKLIAAGISRHEIAFIHDYSTPIAKEKLFKAVNAGDIRFLLGSTPKLGAGTNVQKRLVGLHHIDAPWRPSDLEQREGRIVRRGNELYARDPENFEVFIGRYATSQTYDTRRWQILEHKARGIEQLRNYDGTINEIDDIDGEASNAADMKAAASGDPLILEETRLRNTVRRLEQLQASHADEVLLMSRKARDKQEYAERSGPRYLAKLIKLMDIIHSHPLDKTGYSPISVEGKVFSHKESAQEGIAHIFNQLRHHALLDATIQYRGIEFTVDRHTGWIGVNSETGELCTYGDLDPFSSSGFIQRLANYVNRLPGLVDETKARIAQAAIDAESMREQTKQDFQQADELEATRESYKLVQRSLLVKGPDVPKEQKPAVSQGIERQQALLVKLGFAAELKEFFNDGIDYQLNDAEARLPEIAVPVRMDAGINNYGLPSVNTSSQERSMNKKLYHEVIAEKLIEQIKQGTAPWQRPWQPGEPGAFTPMNPTTGKRYRGINAIQLMSEGRTDQRWMTYKQAEAVGGQVRQGEKGTPIQYWKFAEEQPLTDEFGKPRFNEQGEKLTLSVKLERPRVFYATVFNAEQIEGLSPLQPRKEQEWSAIDRAEHILQASGAVIKHSEHDKAFYRPATDSIHLPDKNQFQSADYYYATALHELGHWTGHSSRLDRDLIHPFGSEGYSKEELRAEIASMLLGDELGIGHDPAQHVAYVASWVSVLQNDPLDIFRAAADAEKIQGYVLGLEQQYLQDQSIQ
ncbi:MAG: zincin-like metallopeptidase domain-containing protein, partial [Halobacteriota archaeon]